MRGQIIAAERRSAFAALVRQHLADPEHLPRVVELIQAGLVYGRHDLGPFGPLGDGVDGDPGELTVSAFIAAMRGETPGAMPSWDDLDLAAGIAAVAPGLKDSEVAEWSEHLSAAATRWGIDTPARLAMWLAQLAHESAGFTKMVESFRYSPQRILDVFGHRVTSRAEAERLSRDPEALANRVYGGRMGNVRPGDGWLYRGRGPGQLTGGANYREMARLAGIPIDEQPDLAADPKLGAQIAGAFWQRHGCSRYADAGDIEGCRRAWNGGTNGLADVRRLWAAAKAALGVGEELEAGR